MRDMISQTASALAAMRERSIHLCERCGTPFEAINQAKYCCPACRQAACKARKKEEVKERVFDLAHDALLAAIATVQQQGVKSIQSAAAETLQRCCQRFAQMPLTPSAADDS
jgi:uncharacterized Zn finger protein (UPF0148 family)